MRPFEMLAISRMTSFELVFIPNHCAFTCILQVNFKMHKICYSKLSCHMLSLSPPFEVFYCFFPSIFTRHSDTEKLNML